MKIRDYLIVLLLCFTFTLYFQYSAITDYYTINDDVRVESYIFFSFLDSELFPGSLEVEWAFARNPGAFNLMYQIGTFIFKDPIIFGKILVFFFAGIIGIFSFKIGEILDPKVGWAFVIFSLLQVWSFPSISGGMSRAFAYPLMLIFFYFLLKRNFLGIFLTMFFQLLFYPIVLLISILSLGLSLIYLSNLKKFKSKIFPKEVKIYFLFILVFCFLLMGVYSFPQSDNLKLVSRENVISHPIFSEEGRDFLYPPKSLISLILKSSPVLSFLALFFVVLYFYFPNKLDTRSYLLPLSGGLLYFLSVLFMPYFYYSDRYIRYTIPIFLTFFVLSQLFFISKSVFSKKQSKRYGGILFIVIVTLISMIMFQFTDSDLIKCEQKSLYDWISQTPKGVIIAAHPVDASCIPTFAHRNVLVSDESIQPMYWEHYKIMESRLYSFFDAYYSDSKEDIDFFCNSYNISYIVINKDKFFIENDYYIKDGYREYRYYVEPFNSRILEDIGEKRDFFLLNSEEVINIDEGLSVYKCN